jgi:hypothetical protein
LWGRSCSPAVLAFGERRAKRAAMTADHFLCADAAAGGASGALLAALLIAGV